MCGEKMGNSMSIQTQKKMMTSLGGTAPSHHKITVVCETVNPENTPRCCGNSEMLNLNGFPGPTKSGSPEASTFEFRLPTKSPR